MTPWWDSARLWIATGIVAGAVIAAIVAIIVIAAITNDMSRRES